MNPLVATPATVAAESARLDGPVHCVSFDTPEGALLAACSDRGLVMLELLDTALTEDAALARVRAAFPLSRPVYRPLSLARISTLPLHLVGTAFQCRVWRALLELAPGTVCHYQDIAARINSGARAVGTAVARNRIAVRVPCHRVVPSKGGSGQYRWGAHRKARLLAQEGVLLAA